MELKGNHTLLAETATLTRTRSRLGTASPSSLSCSPTSTPTFLHGPSLTIPRKKIGILDDVLSNGWLDAMRSSSPTRKKISMDVGHGVASSEADAAYLTWLLEFPSALSSFEQITNCAKGKKIALFLDYDGTLSPIMRAAVKDVAKHFPTAIISGRSREKVHEFVGITDLYYAGSHGMDIIGPLRQSVSDNHPNCIRSTDKKNWDMVAQRVFDIMKDYPHLRLTHGRKVLEVRPVIDWDKGKAVTFLLESLGLNDDDDVLAIYIGDDRTDEDAFKVLSDVKKGFGILVSSAPKESNAVYSLSDPSEVMEFLKSLVIWKSSSI
ncbi:hypothetical protein TSUD_116780 [Trifolium subterraneum]|nr:hypothetical protein TSUD_116780 [Trifolium subterraneum]